MDNKDGDELIGDELIGDELVGWDDSYKGQLLIEFGTQRFNVESKDEPHIQHFSPTQVDGVDDQGFIEGLELSLYFGYFEVVTDQLYSW